MPTCGSKTWKESEVIICVNPLFWLILFFFFFLTCSSFSLLFFSFSQESKVKDHGGWSQTTLRSNYYWLVITIGKLFNFSKPHLAHV